jgi:hypothetical protein
MAKVLAVFVDGSGRVARAPAVLFGVFLVTLVMVIPPGLLVEAGIAAGLGNSRVAEQMAVGVNMEWWDQYLESATGLGRTFTPSVIGFAAVLDNFSRFLDNQSRPPVVVALGTLYTVVWLFLIGGILDRLARNRPLRAHAFFAACGTYFIRFLRLGLIAGAGYYLLFGFVHGWLFSILARWATVDVTVERSAFLLRLALYAVFGVLLVAWTILLDYAKIRAVVEDRRSMLGAIIAGSRFVFRHPKKVGSLWLLNGFCFLVVLGLYAAVAPGAAGSGTAVWAGFIVGQVYIVARLFVKLLLYASQTALFQMSLAHASYTAAPVPVWPESPAVEVIANAAGTPAPDGG